uniref:Protein sleepless n=1 Tax=Anopheles dirus TaxID=7168 RepID=A0A182NQV4_9DIPT
MSGALKLVILCLLGWFAHQAQSLQCYSCMSTVSFDDCSQKAIKANCDDLVPPFPVPEPGNGTFSCGKASGSNGSIKMFVKTCIPIMSEADLCKLISSQLEEPDEKVDVCKACNEDLCNAGKGVMFTGALLLLTVGLIFKM